MLQAATDLSGLRHCNSCSASIWSTMPHQKALRICFRRGCEISGMCQRTSYIPAVHGCSCWRYPCSVTHSLLYSNTKTSKYSRGIYHHFQELEALSESKGFSNSSGGNYQNASSCSQAPDTGVLLDRCWCCPLVTNFLETLYRKTRLPDTSEALCLTTVNPSTQYCT